jgi:hypothetical protein
MLCQTKLKSKRRRIKNSSKLSTHKSANDVTHQKQEQEQEVEGSQQTLEHVVLEAGGITVYSFASFFLHLKFRPTSIFFRPSPLSGDHKLTEHEYMQQVALS